MQSPTLPVAKNSGRTTLALVVLVSGIYFADTCLRASLKTFWMDELFTVYLCRLPSFHATWTAVMRGCDFNPPLLYLLTRWAEGLFGEGLIATRLPSIVAFWVYGLCLYAFVARRLRPLAGGVAALFPFFTLAYFYAFEARAHGIVLGWSGLMLVCWQRARERSGVTLWHLGLFLSFLAALLTHIYAVYLAIPFLTAEAYCLLRERRLNLGSTLAMLLAPACVLPMYLRLVHSYQALTSLGGLPAPLHDVIQQHLISVLGPALVILLVFLIVLAWQQRGDAVEPPSDPQMRFTAAELVLATGLVFLPWVGIFAVRVSHGPFFDRYFLIATAGYGILLAQAISFRTGRSPVTKPLFIAMFCLFLANTITAIRYRVGHAYLGQVEPSSHLVFSTNAAIPLQSNASLLRSTGSEDILVTAEPAYLYLHYYAPPDLRQRLIFGAPQSDDIFLRSYRHLADAGVDLRTTTFPDFFSKHREFLVYGSSDGMLNGGCYDCVQTFLAAGYQLRSVDRDDHYLLEHFSR